MEIEMDFDDWEVIPSDGLFLDDVHTLSHGHGYGTGRRKKAKQTGFDRKGDININNLIYSSPPRSLIILTPISLEPISTNQVMVTQPVEVPKLVFPISSKKTSNEDQNTNFSSQVSFKKVKEPEFVDIKIESPKFNTKSQFEPEPMRFEEKQEVMTMEVPEAKIDKSCDGDHDGGINLWGWRLGGIGTLCYIGVAAVTICIFIAGNKSHSHQNQKMHQFQMYSDDKQKVIKQVVHHQHHNQNRLNQAISAVGGGLALSGVHITWGGHYRGL